MHIDVHLLTTQPAGVTKEALVSFAQEAERRNFASRLVSDHVVIPCVPRAIRPYLEPVVALATAAAVTTKARLGASVFILGQRHPS